MASTVQVKNISATTEDKEIKDFFSFCGKITDIKVNTTGETKEASVTFEKESAAKTAELLNNTQLGSSQISVVPASGSKSADDDDAPHITNAERDSDEITQDEKPRTRIFAEYLAHGYVVGDAALQRAIELDSKHGVSNRFKSTLEGLDQKYHATDRAKAADSSYGVTQRASGAWNTLNSYFEKALGNPTGKKLVNFYENSSRQVVDIHAEARRLADLKKDEHGGSAYKASGLEKVFGKEKPATDGAAAPGTAAPANPEAAHFATGVPEPGPKAGITESKPLAPSTADPASGFQAEK